MSTMEAAIWIAAGMIAVGIAVYRNIIFSRAYHQAVEIIDRSKEKCACLLAQMKDPENPSQEKIRLFQELISEETRMSEIFSEKKRWPSQGKRIKEFMFQLSVYKKNAQQALGLEMEN
ncbi:hypothetical protein [Youxingia wuxianensis]|uniref:Uncharacterized protein n=1 Tax=Youxingia wuxianensis TaxID=2763678 RepID=A0A926END4_9FIRM|nr:hypothetical protein [Youxingia wuxianensis]MBC8585530.1 hypothetical protein [Youxingia wuxianensis]